MYKQVGRCQLSMELESGGEEKDTGSNKSKDSRKERRSFL
jgi:hypothetical protein